uniref:EF-hand domain-containing protein n=1 Tax=Trichobilharzia regenti TaxID=157069 RepID=A0AA85JKY3_TRIRE|nr:unnamed protein product [Trichobilharzia regenti]
MISCTHLEKLTWVDNTFIERNLTMSGSKHSDAIDSSKLTGDSRIFVEVFNALDTNNDGHVCYEELRTGLKSCGFSDGIIEEVMCLLDSNKDGKITLDEFLKALECITE